VSDADPCGNINAKAADLGSSFTGAAAAGCDTVRGGHRRRYRNCDIYHSPTTGVHVPFGVRSELHVPGLRVSGLMATLEQRNHARSFLRKAEEYPAFAEANLAAERTTVAAGDAIHAGICAKDAIITELTGTTTKGKDHALGAKELRQALGQRPNAASAEKGLRELIVSKVRLRRPPRR